MKNRNLICLRHLTIIAMAFPLAAVLQAQSSERKGELVEQLIARVNNQAITMSDYQKALRDAHQDVVDHCQGCTPDKIEAEYKDEQKDVLRDMIDQDLLVDRAKDLSLSADTDVIKHLDDTRRQYGLASLDDLQKAVESQGMDWEDYQRVIRNAILAQKVISNEVGGRLDVGPADVKQYYDAHKQDFVRPEEVDLAEIFLNTTGKSPEEIAAIRTKAEDLHSRVLRGEDFGEIAKRYSEGSTAKDGGGLGTPFQRGQLAKEIEDAVFKMDKGGITDVIQVKTGFEIYKVVDHFQAGQQPLGAVENEIMYKIQMDKMQPAIRTYLAQLREENYVMVKPGYTDTAAVPGADVDMVQEVPATPDAASKKKKKKLPLPKVGGQ